MRSARLKIYGTNATYHCMSRTVNGERLFGDREKEVLRKMLWQVADFSGVEVLTYCILSNHFHVLLQVLPSKGSRHCQSGGGQTGRVISNGELLRRYRVLYPKPTKYQTASIALMEKELQKGGEAAEAIRGKLLARMGDVSEFMKTLKQRFSVWYNRSHDRYGTLWAERFKSVLVEGKGNPLQTTAAYIDLNPVRAGIVADPKDYRFCGYAEAVSGCKRAKEGIAFVWATHADGAVRSRSSVAGPLENHRGLIFGKRAADGDLPEMSRKKALKVLEQGTAVLPKSTVLRCRVRYFTDGAILGSAEFVRGFIGTWQLEKRRKHPPKVNPLRGSNWEDLATIQGLRKQVFG